MTKETQRPHAEVVETPTAKPGLDRSLLPAATTLFARDGYSASTMRALAAELDVTVAAVWHHYKTKDALLLAVVKPVLDAMEAELERISRWSTGVERDAAAARHILRGLLDVWLHHREAFAFVSRDLGVLHHPDHRIRFDRINSMLREQLAATAGLDAPNPRSQVLAAATLGALARPVINLDLDLTEHRHELVEAALRILFGGQVALPPGSEEQES